MKRQTIALALALTISACGKIPSAQEIVDAVDSKISEHTQSADTTDQTDEEIAAQDEAGHSVDIRNHSPLPDNTEFLGTFDQDWKSDACEDMPEVLRLYTDNDHVYMVDQKENVVFDAVIYPDSTFDFSFDLVDVFGKYQAELACTCTYNDNTYTQDNFDCACDTYDSIDDRNFDCGLKYELQ